MSTISDVCNEFAEEATLLAFALLNSNSGDVEERFAQTRAAYAAVKRRASELDQAALADMINLMRRLERQRQTYRETRKPEPEPEPKAKPKPEPKAKPKPEQKTETETEESRQRAAIEREINRVIHAMRDATRLMETFVEDSEFSQVRRTNRRVAEQVSKLMKHSDFPAASNEVRARFGAGYDDYEQAFKAALKARATLRDTCNALRPMVFPSGDIVFCAVAVAVIVSLRTLPSMPLFWTMIVRVVFIWQLTDLLRFGFARLTNRDKFGALTIQAEEIFLAAKISLFYIGIIVVLNLMTMAGPVGSRTDLVSMPLLAWPLLTIMVANRAVCLRLRNQFRLTK